MDAKKDRKTQKLALARLTVRSLNGQALAAAAGGGTSVCTVARWVCYSDTCGPKQE